MIFLFSTRQRYRFFSLRAANPFKLKRAQDLSTSSEDGVAPSDRTDSIAGDNADRAIRSVRSKLDKSLSVQYTVNDLIMSATDEQNLALIFGGSHMTLYRQVFLLLTGVP